MARATYRWPVSVVRGFLENTNEPWNFSTLEEEMVWLSEHHQAVFSKQLLDGQEIRQRFLKPVGS